MKNKGKITAFILILLFGAGSSDLVAQGRWMRGSGFDSAIMKTRRDSMRMQMAGRRMAMMNQDTMNRGMRQFYGRMPYMAPPMMGRGNGMRGFAFGNGRGSMIQSAPGRRIMESIPGITAKQQQELTRLNENQQAEMQKLRENHQEALKTLRDDHRKKVMDLLTNEQKKWLEENTRRQNNIE